MLQSKTVDNQQTPHMAILRAIREASPARRRTQGLPDEVIRPFLENNAALQKAVADAGKAHRALCLEYPDLMAADEAQQIMAFQAGLINFYAADAVNPYTAIAANGPWVITSTGAVIHDSGGYGMLGLGHSPQVVLDAMNQHQVMANVMTPNASHRRFIDALRREVGQTRGGCPFSGFVCLNSGSESMTVALRIADVNAKNQTDSGGRHHGKPIRRVSLQMSFHGRTDRPAHYSDSTLSNYTSNLASFRDQPGPLTVEQNNIGQLEEVFAMADEQGFFIEAVCIEPVMGEGNPGSPTTPEFYSAARRLTLEHGSMFIVDSIQAGLRTHGYLSVIDYPGFAGCDAPDMETYSKALNAGQYPLSVVAMTPRVIDTYRPGIYGNTMTSNPRGLDVACAVLDTLTPQLRQNIRDRGAEFVGRLEALAAELGDAITRVQGTGLLMSCELNEHLYKCFGSDSIEEYLRLHGIGVVHGGKHSLRFTPPFSITSAEIDLIVNAVRDALVNGPRKRRIALSD